MKLIKVDNAYWCELNRLEAMRLYDYCELLTISDNKDRTQSVIEGMAQLFAAFDNNEVIAIYLQECDPDHTQQTTNPLQ